MKKEEFLKVNDIASRLDLSRPKVYDMLKKGVLPSYNIDGVLRVSVRDFEAFLRKSKA